MMNQAKLAVLLLAGASSLAFPSLAGAQTAAVPRSTEVGEVIVTGSRVIRNGDASPTPVTVVNVQDLQAVQPTTVADGLNAMPVFSGSRSQFGNPNPMGGNGAANQLNLRNLGANRNLVLFDGHRVPPTLTDGSVDVDMIPQQLLQRVDVVTGGVSAVYGSDAISGVINFITDRKFDGIKVHAQAGRSVHSDDPTVNAGMAVGTDLFDGRGHFEGSYEYRDDKGILYRSARDWNQQWAAEGAGTSAAPYHLFEHVRLANTAFGGKILSGVLINQIFRTNGVLSPFIHGQPTGSFCCEVGGDGAYYDDSLKAPLRSHQMFGRFDFDFSDSVHGYLVASGNLKRNIQYLGPPQLTNVTLSSTNAFLAPAYQSQLAAAHQTTFRMSEFMSGNAPRQAPESNSRQFFVNGGLDGKFAGFDWDFTYTHGWTRQSTTTHNNLNKGRMAAALDAVVNPANGQIVCNATLTNPSLYAGCAPLNIFGPTASNPAAIRYILSDTQYVAHTRMDDIEGSISRQPFSTWAGPVSIALSGEWRRLAYSQDSDTPPTLLIDCTGLRFNCKTGDTLWQNSNAPRSEVSQTVWEVAAETDVPLVKDAPLMQSLSVNGAVRYTSYRTSGQYTTWKIGLDWHINDDLRFRATRSRDIRAPTLSELYAPRSVGTMTSTDQLTGLAPTVPLYGGGNPNLTAEIGSNSTAGFVWRPQSVPGLSLALDGYYIRIENALSSILGTVAPAQLACYASGGTSPFCALQTRPNGYTDKSPSNAVTAWYSKNINIAEVKTYGLDLEANYSGEMFGRSYSVRGLLNYQPHLIFDTPGLTTLDHAGVAYSTNALYPAPKVAGTILVHYQATDRLTIDVMERWRGQLSMRQNQNQVWVNPKVPPVAYTNLNLAYSVPGAPAQLQVFLNIQNLLDKEPPPAAFYSAQTQPGQFGGWAIGDDPIGRYVTVGVRARL